MASDDDDSEYDAAFASLTPEQLQGLAALDAVLNIDSEQFRFTAPSFSTQEAINPSLLSIENPHPAEFINETPTSRKRTVSPDLDSSALTTKRPRGRPPGTGYKQRQQREETPNEGTTLGSKRPVGRPKKQPQSTFASVPSKYKLTGLRVSSSTPTAGPSNVSVNEALQDRAGATRNPSALSMLSSSPGPTSVPNHEAALQASQGEISLIPGDDPFRACVDDDNDDTDSESGLLEDGIGEDDVDDDDGEDGDEGTQSATSATKSRSRCLPGWLKAEFKRHLEESSQRGADGLPPLYRNHQTFWFPRPATWFRLRTPSLTPQVLYDYRFFLWDPMALLEDGIPCPNPSCDARLRRHDHVRYPRRVVDLDSTFWIIGYRYRCPQCARFQRQAHFRSWDLRILSVLPPSLADEFPAILSYRSGLASSLFHLMRACFHHGMGAHQFSTTIRVQHLERYDRLQLQYLRTIAVQSTLSSFLTGRKFKAFLPYDDRSNDGAHGFVPGAMWLRDTYDTFIEKHEDELNQHTAMSEKR